MTMKEIAVLLLFFESFSAADEKNTSNNCSCFNFLDNLLISIFPGICLIKPCGCCPKEIIYGVLSAGLIFIVSILIVRCCRKKKNSTSHTQEQKRGREDCYEVICLQKHSKEEKHDDTEMKPLRATTEVATFPEAHEQDVSSQQVKYLQHEVDDTEQNLQ
ncbi:uncharacterized protein LOC103131381 isoform X2 [Poecilia formosa]|uniref:uncharacterized protein LOC103131381 isoform X2 n=1 Tax=Poecilia formosa TaxID=48698 RepID=UPI000443BF8B|nr:PREDICTED: uncharacterized protein LOC103131381 isoform X2 [Poecilia formosa]